MCGEGVGEEGSEEGEREGKEGYKKMVDDKIGLRKASSAESKVVILVFPLCSMGMISW